MRLFKDTQESIGNLFVEAGECAGLCGQYVRRDFAEKATSLLSAVIISFVLIFLGGIVLLLLFFALAFLLGDLWGNTALGFGCLTIIALLMFLVVYLCRKRIAVASIARTVSRTIGDTGGSTTTDELEKQLQAKKENLVTQLHNLADDTAEYDSKARRTARIVYYVLSLYNGFRIGVSTMAVINNLLGKTKKRRK